MVEVRHRATSRQQGILLVDLDRLAEQFFVRSGSKTLLADVLRIGNLSKNLVAVLLESVLGNLAHRFL